MADQPSTPDAVKPLRADALRNRARVLRAAQEAFAEEGVAVPLDDIARRAGVGAGTVYRHFPTKEALFEAIVIDRLRALVDRANELAEAQDSGAAFFEFLSLMVDESGFKRDLVDALAGTDLSDGITQVRHDIRAAIERLLTQAKRDGAVRQDIGIRSLMELLSGILLTASQRGPGAGPDKFVVAVVFDGLRAQPR